MTAPPLKPSARFNIFSFKGKIVMVTGAAGGFGRELALEFARRGAALVLVDQKRARLQSIAASIRRRKSRCLSCQADVADEVQVSALISKIRKQFGRIDVLVHVAGEARLSPVTTMTTADFDFTIASHLRGTFLMVREVGRMMCARKRGSVVLMSSISSQCALGRGTAAYAAAKAGINALVRELAVEWAPRGIRINAVAPCQFRTFSLKKMLQDPRYGAKGELERKMITAIPMGRLGEPWEIVGPCIFLASDAASMVTGQVLFVDGGYTAK